jgi:hypothetical protein
MKRIGKKVKQKKEEKNEYRLAAIKFLMYLRLNPYSIQLLIKFQDTLGYKKNGIKFHNHIFKHLPLTFLYGIMYLISDCIV